MKKNLGKIYFAAAILAAFALINALNIFASLQLRSLDIFRRGFTPHPDIVLLAIDDNSLQKIGRWPWDRTVHSDIINKLGASGPRAVAFDIDFFETQTLVKDQALAKSVNTAKFPIIFSEQAIYYQGSSTNQPQTFLKPLSYFTETNHAALGFTNVPESADGLAVIFSYPLQASDGVTAIPLSYQLAQSVNAALPETNKAKNFLVNFAGPPGSYPTYSVSDLLDNKIPTDTLKDKIILIGATASDLHDLVSAPVAKGKLPGIEWHANVLNNILAQNYIVQLPKMYSTVLGFVLAIFFLLLSFFAKTKTIIKFYAGTVLALFLLSFILFASGFALPFFLNIILVTFIFLSLSAYRWFQTEIEKRRIKSSLQFYFSPQVLSMVLQNPDKLKLGGERKEVTTLFSDIRSFTTITESADPELLSKLLQRYFTEMGEEILVTDGVIDKFIGDAIMAFWGAPIEQPNQADLAVTAALGMLKRIEGLSAEWQKQGLQGLNIGIGINTGIATIGNMGSEKRFDYTVIGDSVNVASRLEGLNKEYNTNLIISESTKNKLTIPVQTVSLGEVKVKGKTRGINIYQVVQSVVAKGM